MFGDQEMDLSEERFSNGFEVKICQYILFKKLIVLKTICTTGELNGVSLKIDL